MYITGKPKEKRTDIDYSIFKCSISRLNNSVGMLMKIKELNSWMMLILYEWVSSRHLSLSNGLEHALLLTLEAGWSEFSSWIGHPPP